MHDAYRMSVPAIHGRVSSRLLKPGVRLWLSVKHLTPVPSVLGTDPV